MTTTASGLLSGRSVMMWGSGNGWGGGDGAVIGALVFVILVLIVVGIILIVKGLTKRDEYPPGPPQAPPPGSDRKASLRVLEERYARGEIDREDFLQRRQDLSGD
jgi:putative membrane protein